VIELKSGDRCHFNRLRFPEERLVQALFETAFRVVWASRGVVLDQVMASEGMSGFAFGYAVAIFVQTQFERKLVGRPGLEPGTTGLKVRCSTN
jgi:hypothetical protein